MEVKTTVSTAELLPLISALKLEMQKKGYSPLSIRGLENVWDALLHYASTVPETAFDENFREAFLQAEYGFRMDLEGGVGQDNGLARFLVHLGEGDCPHLRGIVNGDALRHQLHRLLPIEQGHIVHGRVLHIAVRCRFLGYGVRP